MCYFGPRSKTKVHPLKTKEGGNGDDRNAEDQHQAWLRGSILAGLWGSEKKKRSLPHKTEREIDISRSIVPKIKRGDA